MRPQIVITCEGGLVQDVSAIRGQADVLVLDFDAGDSGDDAEQMVVVNGERAWAQTYALRRPFEGIAKRNRAGIRQAFVAATK